MSEGVDYIEVARSKAVNELRDFEADWKSYFDEQDKNHQRNVVFFCKPEGFTLPIRWWKRIVLLFVEPQVFVSDEGRLEMKQWRGITYVTKWEPALSKNG